VRTLRQIGEGRADEHVARIRALGHRRDDQALGRDRRQVLRGVHGDVRAPVEQRRLHLLDEDALAAHRFDRDVEPPIRRRLDHHRVDDHRGIHRAQQGRDVVGLPARQRAPPRRRPHHAPIRRHVLVSESRP
jgi:hypothetical protein